MSLFTCSQYEQLLHNATFKYLNPDPQPVIKLHMERIGCTWLLTELHPENQHIAFGLSDLGMQSPELGPIDLAELTGLKLPLHISLERDDDFIGLYPLSVYARAARACGHITEDQDILRRYQAAPRLRGLYPT